MPKITRRAVLRIGTPLAAVALFAAIFIGRELRMREAHAATAATTAAPPSVPIDAATVERRDVPEFLTGLGTVQAENTVTVKSRVDGQLQQVLYQEGQDVTAGQVLAQIDPRPFQAALDQAKAAKAKDEAQLTNAGLDLQRFENEQEELYAARQPSQPTSHRKLA